MPVICFPREIRNYKEFCEIVKPDAINIDYSVDPLMISKNIKIPVQGGLDPKILLTDKENLKKEILREAKSLSVLIGPEGDFSPSEIELIHGNPNVVPFTISRNILRSDTAVIGAISLVNFINNFH